MEPGPDGDENVSCLMLVVLGFENSYYIVGYVACGSFWFIFKLMFDDCLNRLTFCSWTNIRGWETFMTWRTCILILANAFSIKSIYSQFASGDVILRFVILVHRFDMIGRYKCYVLCCCFEIDTLYCTCFCQWSHRAFYSTSGVYHGLLSSNRLSNMLVNLSHCITTQTYASYSMKYKYVKTNPTRLKWGPRESTQTTIGVRQSDLIHTPTTPISHQFSPTTCSNSFPF